MSFNLRLCKNIVHGGENPSGPTYQFKFKNNNIMKITKGDDEIFETDNLPDIDNEVFNKLDAVKKYIEETGGRFFISIVLPIKRDTLSCSTTSGPFPEKAFTEISTMMHTMGEFIESATGGDVTLCKVNEDGSFTRLKIHHRPNSLGQDPAEER